MTQTSTHDPLSGQLGSEWLPTDNHSRDNKPLSEKGWAHRGSLVALLALTGVLYLWGLGASGYGNDFYAAAVQAGTQSWKAFFFGSFDASNFITVDKPPAALWPMELSGRLFGFNSWSMLVPQALEGVATVWLLYATVKRWFGHWAAILAGALLAITPVAVLMFRFNNPDSLMVLLMVAAAYFVTRAIEAASTRWLLLAGAAMGFSFLAKGLQPFTLLPALAIAYLIAAPTTLRRRVLQLLGAGIALIAGAGWWVLAVQLTPAADRPYIGGSGNNSPLGLAFGYNGLSRLSGSSSGGPGGGFDGSTGIGRMFNSLNGGQIAWLLPTSLIALVALVVASRRAPLADRTRAAAILWGGWLLVTGIVLSFAGGIIHTYYTVELAPAIAALVAIGTVVLWRSRSTAGARMALAVGAVVTGFWTYALLHRTPSFDPWVGYVAVLAGLAAAGLLLVGPGVLRRGFVAAAVVAGLVTLGSGSAAYALDTASTAHTGSVPSAGPTASGAGGGFGGGPGGTRPGRGTGGPPAGAPAGAPAGGFPGGAARGGTAPGGTTGGGTAGTVPSRPTGSQGGGPGGATNVSAALTTLLKATDTQWAAAATSSQTAGPLELASGKAVMSLGGFNGGDNAITLAQFQQYVADGKIHYFIGGGQGGGQGGGGGGGQGSSSAITQWVAAHYTATTVGSTTVYDLTKAATS
jgi:4-amino-4-deoxy-L-arabinose transferase-like glycosyltransferase